MNERPLNDGTSPPCLVAADVVSSPPALSGTCVAGHGQMAGAGGEMARITAARTALSRAEQLRPLPGSNWQWWACMVRCGGDSTVSARG